MAYQAQPSGLLDQIFANPALKAALAAVGAVGTLTKYIKRAGLQRAQVTSIAYRYALTGPIFWLIVRLPAAIHQTVAFGVLVLSGFEIVALVDQYGLRGSMRASLPDGTAGLVTFISNNFAYLFMFSILFYVLFELRAIEKLLLAITGLVPAFKQTVEWANAFWQTKADDAERKILAPSHSNIRSTAAILIDEIINEGQNDSLALRPEGLDEADAANILYFGHVFEAYRSEIGSRYSKWTAFYEALALVAKAPNAPFSPKTINSWTERDNFLEILVQANPLLDEDDKISNDAVFEQEVHKALFRLKFSWQGDARKIGDGWFEAGFPGTTYSRVLGASAQFLKTEGMRRQFAKLFILWGLVPGATRPDVFRIPFNSSMFIRYLDDGVIRAEGAYFDYTTLPALICFEEVEKQILELVLEVIDDSRDAKRTAWRAKELELINGRGIDWRWWVFYRADTQAYRDAREYTSATWRVSDDQEILRNA